MDAAAAGQEADEQSLSGGEGAAHDSESSFNIDEEFAELEGLLDGVDEEVAELEGLLHGEGHAFLPHGDDEMFEDDFLEEDSGSEADPSWHNSDHWHADPSDHIEDATAMAHIRPVDYDGEPDDGRWQEQPPPAQQYESPPAWTAGPYDSGGYCHSTKMWPRTGSHSPHRQTADAMHVHTRPDGVLEVTLVDQQCHCMEGGLRSAVSVHRFVAEGRLQIPKKVASASLPSILGMRSTPYTVARSIDGVTIACGLDDGTIFIYTFNEVRGLGRQQKLRLDLQLKLGHDMVNSLRFMSADDVEYLVVADQHRRVWMFTNPNTEENTRGKEAVPWSEYAVPSFAEQAPDGRTPNWQQVSMAGVCVDAGQGAVVTHVKTAVRTIGFDRACNSAQPSPSARFIAVLVDEGGLVILRKDQGYRYDSTERRRAMGSNASAEERIELTAATKEDRPAWAAPLDRDEAGLIYGGQYCSWNADETLLAASSDSSHSVTVWSVPPATQPGVPHFQRVLRVAHTLREALALAFHPTDPGLLCFSERKDRVHLIDIVEELRGENKVTGPARSLQTLTAADHSRTSYLYLRAIKKKPSLARRERNYQLPQLSEIGGLNGVAFSRDNRLFVATRTALVEVSILKRWSFRWHVLYPAAFKAAAKALLMCANRRDASSSTSTTAPGLTLQDLPALVVAKIIAELAKSYKSYLPPCSTQMTVERQ